MKRLPIVSQLVNGWITPSMVSLWIDLNTRSGDPIEVHLRLRSRALDIMNTLQLMVLAMLIISVLPTHAHLSTTLDPTKLLIGFGVLFALEIFWVRSQIYPFEDDIEKRMDQDRVALKTFLESDAVKKCRSNTASSSDELWQQVLKEHEDETTEHAPTVKTILEEVALDIHYTGATTSEMSEWTKNREAFIKGCNACQAWGFTTWDYETYLERARMRFVEEHFKFIAAPAGA